mmetsp:Transcript_1018/g.1995  ORF Transcript_1018/g.1995 Transcript_1018/m.1995 type:complete len:81 (-) Transcript_1018:182-424(-)
MKKNRITSGLPTHIHQPERILMYSRSPACASWWECEQSAQIVWSEESDDDDDDEHRSSHQSRGGFGMCSYGVGGGCAVRV